MQRALDDVSVDPKRWKANFTLAMMIWRKGLAFFALLAAGACTSAEKETVEACIAKFAESADLIGFLDREKFDTIFTYRVLDSAASEIMVKDRDSLLPEKVEYQIVDGQLSARVRRRAKPTGDIVAEGCKNAPDYANLENIERVPVATDDR